MGVLPLENWVEMWEGVGKELLVMYRRADTKTPTTANTSYNHL